MHTLTELYVDVDGNDSAPGTIERPVQSLARALVLSRSGNADGGNKGSGNIDRSKSDIGKTIYLRRGVHFLDGPVTIMPCDSGLAIRASGDEVVTLSGGTRLSCDWKLFRGGIYVTDLPKGTEVFTQLFADGVRQVRARFPNRADRQKDPSAGYLLPVSAIGLEIPDPTPDRDSDMTYDSEPARGIVFDPATFTGKRWSRPQDGVIHIFQNEYWGNLQWKLKALDHGRSLIWFGSGGQQMGAKWTTDGSIIGPSSRFYIENILEELDAPREWFFDADAGKLYWMPEAGMDPERAEIIVPRLKTLVSVEGSRLDSVEGVSFEGIRFAHTETTFFEEYEVPSLGDWALHRGGAVRLEGTRGCAVRNCLFEGLGGNGVFANRFNRGLTVYGCAFRDIGDSGVLLVGELETTTGTQKHFPYECRVDNNHFHDLGRYGKQTAAVYISRAKRITVSHNLIHDLPRAGICIGDGTWGGHVIEYNHIHHTCLETLDHGPFNAWGRDRAWSMVHGQSKMLKNRCIDTGDALTDAMEPVVLRHNFFAEDHGWGLDLDDGASNYEIYNNICVGIGMKLREGSHRTIYNNIWVNCASSPCFHVGNEDNHDRYFNNITVMSPAYQKKNHDRLFDLKATGNEIYYLIYPPVRTPWLERCDANCFYNDLGRFVLRVMERESTERRDIELPEWQAMGFDRNSLFGDPLFIDPARDDYRVRPESPALKLGFENFEMGAWGLLSGFKPWPEQGDDRNRYS